MATRQQGVFRHHARAEVIAGEWDSHLLQVGGWVWGGGRGRMEWALPKRLHRESIICCRH